LAGEGASLDLPGRDTAGIVGRAGIVSRLCGTGIAIAGANGSNVVCGSPFAGVSRSALVAADACVAGDGSLRGHERSRTRTQTTPSAETIASAQYTA
jgi:hypothetical protein